METTIMGKKRDSGKGNGNYFSGFYKDNGEGNGNYFNGLYRNNGSGNGNYYILIGLSRQPPPLDKRGLPCLKLITILAMQLLS